MFGARHWSQTVENIPKQVDEYSIGNLIGDGVTGSTYAATTEGPDRRLRQVVVKFCHTDRAVTLSWMPRLMKEKASSVIKYLAVAGKAKRWSGYYVGDRFNVIAPSALLDKATFEERLNLVATLADGIASLHGSDPQMVHGWLKPSNVLIRRERDKYYPILTDVGVRPIYKSDFHDAPQIARDIYPYLAPEAVDLFRSGGDPESLGPAADVYGLGAFLCVVMTGVAPGISEWETSADEILAAKHNRSYFVNALVDPRAPVDIQRVNDVLRRALSKDPSGRPSAGDFASELRACVLEPQPQS
jgi:serine/threonine protein kinase